MTQEQKELLFKDLCARLPHGVKICYEAVEYYEKYAKLVEEYKNNFNKK